MPISLIEALISLLLSEAYFKVTLRLLAIDTLR